MKLRGVIKLTERQSWYIDLFAAFNIGLCVGVGAVLIWLSCSNPATAAVVVSCPAGTVWIAEINGVLSCVQEGKQP